MALETVVFQQDPFSYNLKNLQNDFVEGDMKNHTKILAHNINTSVGQSSNLTNGKYLDYHCTKKSSSMVQNGNTNYDIQDPNFSPAAAAASVSRGKRRRMRSVKSKEEVESQRMTHIAVERNRRKQMNDYLSILRSMMPSSYVQRADQASVIGGAINFVKELEQLIQCLEVHRRINQQSDHSNIVPPLFSDFFIFPQYSTFPVNQQSGAESKSTKSTVAEKPRAIADVEVTMVESHANIKVLLKRHQKQLVNMVVGLQFLGLVVLHLNVTTADSMILYSFSVKVEDDSQLTSVNEIAASVYEMVGRIQEQADLIS